MILKISSVLCLMIAATYGAIAPGQNAYLPPKQQPGYDYQKPNVPFQPSPAPAPTPFRPSPTPPRPTYGVPSQPPTPFQPRPSQPSYGLPSPQPPKPFVPSPQPKPTYGPPQGPPSTGPAYVAQQTGTSGQHADHGDHHHHEPGMPFDFNYAVKDDQYGNDYSHNAVSDGDVTTGEYRIQLPDGRTQIVKYTADWKSGFHAQVRYEGTPTYPQYQGRPSNQAPSQVGPTYQPQQPTGGYPSGPARPSQPTQGYPSGPARPSTPTQGYPSGPARPSPPTQGYPSGPARPPPQNQLPGQQYAPGGGYKY